MYYKSFKHKTEEQYEMMTDAWVILPLINMPTHSFQEQNVTNKIKLGVAS